MITGIDHIDIAVRDLDEAVDAFLKLGFELVRRTNHHRGTVEVKLPGPNQPIFDLHPILPERGEGDVTGVLHIAFTVDDIHKSFDEMKSLGFKFNEKQTPHLTKPTGRWLFNICNPDSTTSKPIDGWGFYLQFAGPERVEPV